MSPMTIDDDLEHDLDDAEMIAYILYVHLVLAWTTAREQGMAAA